MNTLDSISDGPVGHEELMQICGLTLPVFVLPATIHVAPINACLKFGGSGNARAKLDQVRKLNLRVRFCHAPQRASLPAH